MIDVPSDIEFNVTGTVADVPSETLLVIPVFKGEAVPQGGAQAPDGPDLQALLDSGTVRSGLYDPFPVVAPSGGRAVLLLGAGPRAGVSPTLARNWSAAAARWAVAHGFTRIAVVDAFGLHPDALGYAIAEGAVDGPLGPGLKKTHEESREPLASVTLVTDSDASAVSGGAARGQIVGQSRAIARTLVNMPPNDLTPSRLADIASELANRYGFECDVLDETALREKGFGAILGVAAGSAQPPRLICLRTGGSSADTTIAFVGKGLTFDSGGLSIKTAEGMETMKCDMGGGAAVLAGVVALARLGVSGVAVRGYIGATENMSGGAAMRPGDVLTAFSGETIEVLNTDAEGRLVLADVLSYAVSEGATHIVDFATLTGGAVVALGNAATLAVGRPDPWVAEVVQCGAQGLERSWQMPLYEEYRRAMDSDVADIKNTGGRSASALTAAAFLSDFVGDARWAHMDIAGTAFASSGNVWRSSGGTGEGVGTIVAVGQSLASQKSPRAGE